MPRVGAAYTAERARTIAARCQGRTARLRTRGSWLGDMPHGGDGLMEEGDDLRSHIALHHSPRARLISLEQPKSAVLVGEGRPKALFEPNVGRTNRKAARTNLSPYEELCLMSYVGATDVLSCRQSGHTRDTHGPRSQAQPVRNTIV